MISVYLFGIMANTIGRICVLITNWPTAFNALCLSGYECLMLNAHLPTENRRSSVGKRRPDRRRSYSADSKFESALQPVVGRCVPNADPIVSANRQVCIDFSTVGGKLTNHSYHFQLFPGYFPGTHTPRFGGNLCLNWLQLFNTFSSFLLRCFHPTSFKTSLHIFSDAKTTFSNTQ